MRDNEMIEFKGDCTFYGLDDELWCEAKDKWRDADFETRCAVWDRVKEWCDAVCECKELPGIREINDMIAYDCDDLFYPPSFTVEVWEYDSETDSVGEQLSNLTETFTGLKSREHAVEYAEGLDNVDRRITVTNDETGEVTDDY